jgi:hypothetical protein
MPQLKVKMNGKEWDSGVGRDDTYGKCGRKKGKLRERNQQQRKGCFVDWEAESSMPFVIRCHCSTVGLGCAT